MKEKKHLFLAEKECCYSLSFAQVNPYCCGFYRKSFRKTSFHLWKFSVSLSRFSGKEVFAQEEIPNLGNLGEGQLGL
jgi:hypothetical protein